MIALVRRLGARAGAFLLLPLSVIPLLLVGPGLLDSHARFDREFHSQPLPAPVVVFTPAEVARYTPVSVYAGAVPVLAYHGISDRNDGLSVSREEFARQLQMLRHSGYHAISIAQYLRFRGGDSSVLPDRPILITFDDGRLDAYRGADRILQQQGMRAVMYVNTEPVRSGDASHVSWKELHAMQRSGRWDVQPSAHDGHRMIVTDGAGRTGPYYTSLRFTRTDGVESYADYTRRVAGDIYAVKDDFRAQGLDSQSFAAAFADDDPHSTARMRKFRDSLLASQFTVAFFAGGADPGYTTPGTIAQRFVLRTHTTTDGLRQWLVRNIPNAKGPS